MIRLLSGAVLASVALVAVYLALGGGTFEPRRPTDPCAPVTLPGGEGITDTLQRIGLAALGTSACDLGVTRERLLLGLAGRTDLGVDPDRATAAFRTGLKQALDEETRSGRIPETQAFLLRQGIDLLPIEALIDRLLSSGG